MNKKEEERKEERTNERKKKTDCVCVCTIAIESDKLSNYSTKNKYNNSIMLQNKFDRCAYTHTYFILVLLF